MSTAAEALLLASNAVGPIRVMVVDDAVVVRGLLSRWVDGEPDMKKRDLVVIMASTLTRRNAEVSLRALALGAADYIPKPLTTREVTTSAAFRRELIEKIRQLGRRKRPSALAPAPERKREPVHGPDGVPRLRGPSLAPAARAALPGEVAELHLRPFARTTPRVLAIGTSTGGPQALIKLVGALGPVIDAAPVLITQHMPPTCTTVLAELLAQASGRRAHEGVDGEPIVPGTIYVAPGGRHMRVVRHPDKPVIALDDGELVNFCKPAVDPMFASVAEIWGIGTLAIILTGMGVDGTRGAADIVAAGGSVIAQDEATSIVWGMPGSAARAGLCSAVLPLEAIAAKTACLFSGDRS
jgi:two-component system chemotaxis response regulator CheB